MGLSSSFETQNSWHRDCKLWQLNKYHSLLFYDSLTINKPLGLSARCYGTNHINNMIINIGLMYKQYVAWNMYKLYTNDALLTTWCRYIPRCKTSYGTFQRWFWLITIIGRGLWSDSHIMSIIKSVTWMHISHSLAL